MFVGRCGMVVVVVVVVVVSPGRVLLVVVVVVVVDVVLVLVLLLVLVVSLGRVLVVGGVGHDAVAFVGIRTAAEVICSSVVVVAEFRTVDSGTLVSVGASARDAAGATEGASLWSHVSN
jgi:hypothetical protein